MDDVYFGYPSSAEDAPRDNEWVTPGNPWDEIIPEDWIRGFRLAHNTTTIFEPCSRCGAVYYRGPFHIVKQHLGILCWECAAKIPLPVTRLLQAHVFNHRHWHLENACTRGEGMIRIVAATQCSHNEDATPELPPEQVELLADLRGHAEERECFVLHYIKGYLDDFYLYTCFDQHDLQIPPLKLDERSPLNGFIREHRKAFASFDHILLQRNIPAKPSCPPVLRTLEEWRKL